MTDRLTELATNWSEVTGQVAATCQQLGRDFSEVQIIAVTKTWPASDVDLLAEVGVQNIGENRDQEAATKKLEVSARDLTWHAIGQIQTNKVKSIAQWANVVHSVDRPELVSAFAKVLGNQNTELGVFIQVNLDPQTNDIRGGLRQQEVMALAEQILEVPNLNLLGVMAVAPLNEDPEPAFAKLADISEDLVTQIPTAKFISAGMSADYEIALKYGATHLRLGSAILGHR